MLGLGRGDESGICAIMISMSGVNGNDVHQLNLTQNHEKPWIIA